MYRWSCCFFFDYIFLSRAFLITTIWLGVLYGFPPPLRPAHTQDPCFPLITLSIIILLLLNFLSICLCKKSTLKSPYQKYYIDDDCCSFSHAKLQYFLNTPTETKGLWFPCFNILPTTKAYLCKIYFFFTLSFFSPISNKALLDNVDK